MAESKYYGQEWFRNNLPIKNSNQKWQESKEKIAKSIQEMQKNTQKIGFFEDTKALDPKSLKEIYDKSNAYWAEHKTFRKMPQKQLKNLLQILFPSPNNGVKKGLYENPDQFDDLLNTLIQKNKQFLLKKLMSELLYYYPKSSLLFNRLKKTYNSLDKTKPRNKFLIQANEKFKLIEAEGPELIAKEILDLNKNLSDVLQAVYIKNKHFTLGIGVDIVDWICYLITPHIERENEQVLNRFLEYLSGDQHTQGISKFSVSSLPLDQFTRRFNDIKPVVATLLIPFENKNPKPLFKQKITQFLDQHIGDPRFQSENWLAVPEKEIFLKWKIGETLTDFFALLDYTAKEHPDADRMWPYRKEFIESYWEAGYITEAWIVLGKEAYKNRTKFLKANFNNYGKIIRWNTPIHSALLFKIRGLIFTEWNYNGAIRIWHEGNQYVPGFYQQEYLRRFLVQNPDKDIPHHYAEQYYWQKKIKCLY